MNDWRRAILSDGMTGTALDHYCRRLDTIRASPELEGSSMIPVIIHEAGKTRIKAGELVERMRQGSGVTLSDEDVSLVESALRSYQSDILRALEGTHEYYTKLVDVSSVSEADAKAAESMLGVISRSRAEN